jgi:hypothetical protein
MCTYDRIRSTRVSEVEVFSDNELMRALRDQVADRGKKLAFVDAGSSDQQVIFSEVGNYFLCMLTLIGGRNVSEFQLFEAMLHLGKVKSNVTTKLGGAKKGESG